MNFKTRILLLCVLFSVSAQLSFGQAGATGTILGTVTDASGAVVANAAIDITNVATGVVSHTVTSTAGDYTVPFLLPGAYKVTAQAPGFEKGVADGVVLVVAQQARVNFTMKLGAVSQTVEVKATTVALDTDTSSISQTVSRTQVDDLPLNGRNFMDLIFVGGGAVQTLGEQAAFRSGADAAISINGQRATSNSYTLDGMPNQDAAEAQPAVILSVDAIQEMKEQTATYGAQFGYSANQVDIVTKSGANGLHGTAYEFDRNNFFDGRGPFEPEIPPLRQNQFGFALGGPVYLPHVYNGKNKTFWFANYEGWRIRQGAVNYFNVPTPNLLAGDFTTSVTDPTTGAPFAGCTANGTVYTSCVPQDRWSRLANLAAAKFYPAAPNSSSPLGDFVQSASNPQTEDQQNYRIDENLGRYGSVFARGTHAGYTITTSAGVDIPIGNSYQVQSVTTWVVSHTVNFGPHIINQAHFGHLSVSTDLGGYGALPSDIAALQLQNVFTNLSDLQRVYPDIQYADGRWSNVGGAGNAYTANEQPEWDFGDSVTWIHGRHTVTTGLDFRHWLLNRNVADNFLGNPYIFDGFATGNEFADFLLGYYSEADVFQPGPESSTAPGAAGNPTHLLFMYVAPYVQDDWKVTNKLTINLGLRYDYRSVPYDTENHYGWRDLSNALGGLCIADQSLLTNGIAPAGNGYYRYCGMNAPATPKKPFAPRFGFAYRLGGKTVIRGGYGIYFDANEGREYDGAGSIYPYVSRGAYKQTAGQSAPLQTTDSLFPSFASAGVAVPADNSFIAVIPPPVWHDPYVQQYSLSVQRALGRNTTLEVNYVGNRGLHLLSRDNVAQVYAPADPAACIANPSAAGCTIADRAPYPNFGVYIEDDYIGYSLYNAMNVKFEHRARDLAVTAVYTYAKSLDDKSAAAAVGATSNGWQGFLNNHDPSLDYGPSDFDVPNRFVGSLVYKLPFGRGKHFLGSASKLADAAVGGWQLNGLLNAQNGFPFSATGADGTGAGAGQLQLNATNRANQVGEAYPSGFNKTLGEWFNTAAFVQPESYTYGNTGRNILRLPSWYDVDMSLFKNFNFTERTSLQLRLETFNTFNHAQFGIDPSNPSQEATMNVLAFPTGNVNSPQYGIITTGRRGRIVQLGVKLYF
jgi:hypothetical protein